MSQHLDVVMMGKCTSPFAGSTPCLSPLHPRPEHSCEEPRSPRRLPDAGPTLFDLTTSEPSPQAGRPAEVAGAGNPPPDGPLRVG